MDRDFKGVWIPKEIWLNKELSLLDKVMLTEIGSLDNENHCTASNDYFAEFFSCGTATITRSITHLKELGYIEELPYNGRMRTLRVIKMISLPNQNDYSDKSKRLANNITNNTDNKNFTNVKLEQPTAIQPKQTKSSSPLVTVPTVTEEPKKKVKKKNLYEKCVDALDAYTDNQELKDVLMEFLKIRLAVKEQPLYFPKWQSLLKDLTSLATTDENRAKIVRQSIEKGWLSFYELKQNKGQYGGKYGKDKFNEFGVVKSVTVNEEDITDEAF